MPRTGVDGMALGCWFGPVRKDGNEPARAQFLLAHVLGKANDAQSGEGRAFQSLQVVDGKPSLQADLFPFTRGLEQPCIPQPIGKAMMVVEILRTLWL